MNSDHTTNPSVTDFADPADAALIGQLAMLARVDGLAMPEGLEAALVMHSAAAARSAVAPMLRLAGDTVWHAPGPRVVPAQRWRLAGARLAAGVALMLVTGLAIIARREGAANPSTIATNTTGKATPGATVASSESSPQETSDWAIVTAVLGDTPASDMRDLWSDAAKLDERIKSNPSSSELLTSEGSL